MLLNRSDCRLPHGVDHELFQGDAAENGGSLEEGLLFGINARFESFGQGSGRRSNATRWGCHREPPLVTWYGCWPYHVNMYGFSPYRLLYPLSFVHQTDGLIRHLARLRELGRVCFCAPLPIDEGKCGVRNTRARHPVHLLPCCESHSKSPLSALYIQGARSARSELARSARRCRRRWNSVQRRAPLPPGCFGPLGWVSSAALRRPAASQRTLGSPRPPRPPSSPLARLLGRVGRGDCWVCDTMPRSEVQKQKPCFPAPNSRTNHR